MRHALLAALLVAAAHGAVGPALSAQVPAPSGADTGSADAGTAGGDPGAPVERQVVGDSLAVPADAEPVAPEQEETDEAIRTRLQALFDRIGALQDVEVEVEAGLVRLQGRALSLEARQQAAALARETEGVLFVEDDLRVVTDLSQRLQPAFDRIREYALGLVALLPLLVVAFGIVVAMLLLGRWVSRWEGPHLRFADTSFVRGLVRQAIQLAFGLAGILVALELLDATALVGAVLGTAGVFGLALGFAFKDIVENHLAGVMLSLRQPFAPNDHVLVGDQEGKVVRLTARETILMTLAGNHVRIPNAELYRSVLTNYTRNPRRRFDFQVSVGTEDDLVLAQEAGLDALRAMTGVMDEPEPAARVVELGDSWVTLHFFGWVDQIQVDFGRVRSEAVRLVKLALERAEVAMPSPEYSVLLRDEGSGPGRVGEKLQGGPRNEIEKERKKERKEPRKEPRTEPTTTPAAAAPAKQQDVSVDHTLDEQIAEDREMSEEDDLLTPS